MALHKLFGRYKTNKQKCILCGYVKTSPNVFNNHAFALYNIQVRTAVFGRKKLFFPKYKRKAVPHYKKKEYMFSNETLNSLSHGQDWITRIRTSEHRGKTFYRQHPLRTFQRLWSDILGYHLWLPVSDHALQKIQIAGSLDRYILCTDKKNLASRLGEHLRYVLLRALERKEDEIIKQVLNGDQQFLPIAYQIVLRQERDEHNALKRRNKKLREIYGHKVPSVDDWTRKELQKRVQMIQTGQLSQIMPKEPPLWKQLVPFFEAQHSPQKSTIDASASSTSQPIHESK
ncbi:hypothetical protein RFI_37877 [Reticulomyxa filosa]|uniref:39S ribosomal protein L28, mitochondrial n=1 Tax=Reticulomyxa filosa TaxID=46433 RepID=X6LC42_RETFI|nr:hypothetical protein RFI_37877 [Reticulomyxa filosa]|eukprot:ETN99592.1 hypothetical protein RFI_37877 [Reticulomyxa filosa]